MSRLHDHMDGASIPNHAISLICCAEAGHTMQTRRGHKGSHLGKNAVHNAVSQRMIAVSQEVLFANQKVMVCIQLPELHIRQANTYCCVQAIDPLQQDTSILAKFCMQSLPYLTVYYIKVLVREVLENFIDVILFVQ